MTPPTIPLYIGKKEANESLKLNPEGLFRHTVVIGQSGSGKSFMLGRLIEEIILQTHGKIVIFDSNSDFIQLKDPDEDVYGNPEFYFGTDNEFDKEDNFKNEWDKLSPDEIITFQSTPKDRANLFIPWRDLSEKDLRQLVGLSPDEYPNEIWLLKQLRAYSDTYDWTLDHWKALCSLMVKWTRKTIRT